MTGASAPAGHRITSTGAARALGLNRSQITRLVQTGLLPAVGWHGRARLLDSAALAQLASRRTLQNTGPDAASAAPYALAVHLSPLAAEDPALQTINQRTQIGWHANQPVPDEAWTGWWNCGERIADEAAASGWPLLPAISGIVVTVRMIVGWDPHLVMPGVVRFQTRPPTDGERAEFEGTAFQPSAGPPWQRLWGPISPDQASSAPPLAPLRRPPERIESVGEPGPL